VINYSSQDRSASKMVGYKLDSHGSIPSKEREFFFATTSRLAMGNQLAVCPMDMEASSPRPKGARV
jgi:hypothetical protein